MKIRISKSAFNDLAESTDFYESQKKGLGSYFQDSLFSDIDSLKLYAGIHSKHFGKHRCLSKRFPYAIYYKIENETIIVVAILGCQRHPALAKQKLK